MSKSEQGPKVYALQDHLDMAKHFKYNVSTDKVEVATRHAEAGTGKNINDDQATGLVVAARTFSLLEDLDDQVQWADLVAGAELNSGLYHMREVEPRMYRNVPIPPLFPEGAPVSMARFRVQARNHLGNSAAASFQYAEKKLNDTATDNDTEKLGRRLLLGAMRLSMWGIVSPESMDEAEAMEAAKSRIISVHDAVKDVARATKTNPSLAQLRAETTPYGSHIVRSTKKYSPRVIQAFKETSRELGSKKGY